MYIIHVKEAIASASVLIRLKTSGSGADRGGGAEEGLKIRVRNTSHKRRMTAVVSGN